MTLSVDAEQCRTLSRSPVFVWLLGPGSSLALARSLVRDTRSRVPGEWSADYPNLWFAGSSLFPTSGTANPTLTIAALALRTAEAIRGAMGQ